MQLLEQNKFFCPHPLKFSIGRGGGSTLDQMVGFPLGWIFILSGWRITVLLCWISVFWGLIYPFSVFWLHPHTCMTCHLSTKLDVHFVGFTMGDEPLVRFNGRCNQGRGVLGVAKGMTTWPKGEGVRQQRIQLHLPLLDTHPHTHPRPTWLSAHRADWSRFGVKIVGLFLIDSQV